MRIPTLFLALLLLAGALPAQAGMDKAVSTALDQALHARGSALSEPLAKAADAAWASGASGRELLALVREAPAQAQPAELAQALDELKGLLDDGLLEREARKAASRSLEARVRARVSGRTDGKGVNGSKGAAASTDAARQQRRDEVRSQGGRLAPAGDLSKPTPTHN